MLDADGHASSFLDDAYWALLSKVATGKSIAILWNGNQHNAGFLLAHEPPFRVLHGGSLPSGDGVWLPRQLLREYWNPSFDELRAALPRLTAVATVYLVGTPPPKSQALIRSVIEREPFFVEQAASLKVDLAELRVTEPSTRLAMWEILQEMLQECAAEFGAVFIPVPGDVMDADGILLPRYGSDDATHGNADYAARLWKEVAAAMREKESAS